MFIKIITTSLFLILFTGIASAEVPSIDYISEKLETIDSLLDYDHFDSVITLGQDLLDSSLPLLDTHDSLVTDLMLRIGEAYRMLWKADLAVEMCWKARELRRWKYGPAHPLYAEALYENAMALNYQDKKPESEAMHRKALEIQMRYYGEEHVSVARSYSKLGLMSRNQARIQDAAGYEKKAYDIYLKVLGPDNRETVAAGLHLGLSLFRLGRIKEAEKTYRNTLENVSLESRFDSTMTSKLLNNLGNTCEYSGSYAEAEKYYRRSIELKTGVYGANHSDVASSLQNLGELYIKLGRLKEAESLIFETLEIYRDTSSVEHSTAIARCYENLSLIYRDQGKLVEANESIEKAISIIENNAIWTRYYDVIGAFVNASEIYIQRGEYERAESKLRTAIDHGRNVFLYDNPTIARAFNALAILKFKTGSLIEANTFADSALKHQKNSVGENNTYADFLVQKCKILRRMGDPSDAIRLIEEACRIKSESIINIARFIPEMDALRLSYSQNDALNEYLSCYHDLIIKPGIVTSHLISALLSQKGSVSEVIFYRQNALEFENDPAIMSLADSLQAAKHDLANYYFRVDSESTELYERKLDNLKKNVRIKEDRLCKLSNNFKNFVSSWRVDPASIAALIPAGAILLEYMKYDYIAVENDSSAARYLVVTLDRKGKGELHLLDKADEIENIIKGYRRHMNYLADTGIRPSEFDMMEYMNFGRRLFEKLLEPIRNTLEGRSMILIAPDGELNTVSFAGLPIDDSTFLIEKYKLHYLSAGRDLIRNQNLENTGRGLLALGNPDFNERSRISVPVDVITRQIAFKSVPNGGKIFLSGLPNSEKEIEDIIRLWQDKSDEPVRVLLGKDATERNFKNESVGKRVIHLATHGFFIKNGNSDQFDLPPVSSGVIENPLLRSGLFLAGVNAVANGSDEDGILTAYEISALNLKGLDLVVLSACESGLGDILNCEGVYGLRRAFQVAGAKTVISTLWSISDEVSSRMMKSLYSNRESDIPGLMRSMEIEEINRLRDNNRAAHPVLWGAYISIGDWR